MTAIAAISAFGSIDPITATGGGGFGIAARPARSGPVGGIDFADALAKVQSQIDGADELSRQLATGQLSDIHDYTVAASKAQLAVELTVALRNQALGAYQELMRMPL